MQQTHSSRHPEAPGKQSPDSVRNIAPNQRPKVFIPTDGNEISTLVPSGSTFGLKDELSLVDRVRVVLRAIHTEQPVSDAALVQHREDCRFLLESAWDRFLATSEEKHKVEAYAWMAHRSDAMQRLSPEWQAAREAAIQAQIGDYFIECGKRDRAALLAANDAGA